MTYVLDTNAVSALMKGAPTVVYRLEATNPGDVGIPHPVIAEIAYGIERLPRSKRHHGGGTRRYVISLIPAYRPNVVSEQGRPAMFHADFSPVTAERPARPGEVLILTASGLGPTDPGVEPGSAFPQDRNLPVLVPVEASVNGTRADVVSAIGWPGRVDNYRVDVQLPTSLVNGTATLQLTAAWVKVERSSSLYGSEVAGVKLQ